MREGTDVTVIAIGPLVHRALDAAKQAEADGISVEVVDPRTLQPLDEETLVASVKKTNRAVVAHEAVTRMGFGAEVAAVLQYQAFDYLDAPIERVGREVRAARLRAGDGAVRRSAGGGRARRDQAHGGQVMASEVKLPRLGQGMESGTVTKWLKSEGETVEKGEPLFEVDTDKVTQEVESDFSGVLLKIALPEGEAPVGQTIAWIGEAGEVVATSAPAEPAEPKAETLELSSTESNSVPEVPRAGADHERPCQGIAARAPPGARARHRPRVAPGHRARWADRRRRTSRAPGRTGARAAVPSGEVERIPLTNIRKTIARRLTAAWQAPVFQLTVTADMTRANELVARARELNPDVRITVTDLLAKVCAQALMRHRDVNVQYADDELLRFPTANVGIAVAAPQGLIVPVLRSVERLSLAEVAAVRVDVVGRARDNKLTTQDLEDGTFTISNLGMFGIEQFVAVLNPPQAAILAVGATVETPVARNGDVEIRPMLTMTLTVDHRAVDGAEGADFLRTVKQFVEDPALAL